jgi:putative phosphoribosyl transferase
MRENMREIPSTRAVAVHAGHVVLTGDLSLPAHRPLGVIVFAHGSGSSRLSPRNARVAQTLVTDGFATLLFDLLTQDEEIAERVTRHLRFDIGLLAARLQGALAWVEHHAELRGLPIGLFGASTGAAAALIAAAHDRRVRAVVSRGGRPDLAGHVLPRIVCPTLLVVGGRDRDVLVLNRAALSRMSGPCALHVVPDATHLFEEAGALAEVTRVASAWFREHLVDQPDAGHPTP